MSPVIRADDRRILANYFNRNGYVRRLDKKRRAKEGRDYKKGAEVRLVAQTLKELAEIRRLLRRCGFPVARPFQKGRQWRQPIYGVETVANFLRMVRPPKKKRAASRTRQRRN